MANRVQPFFDNPVATIRHYVERWGKVVRDAAASNYRFSSLVIGVVNSTPFQMRIKPADEPAATRAAN